MSYRVLGACVLLTFGCSTTSTITRINEAPVEGDIVGGSPDSIFVRGDNGREYEIPRDDVSDIDYPGNVHTNVGVGVLAYGVLNIAVGMPKCNRQTDNQAAYCTGVFLPAAIGAGLIVWGLIVHHGQTAAVADTSRPSTLPPPPPPLRIRKRPAAPDAAPSDTDGAAPPVAPASDATAPAPSPSAAAPTPTASYPLLPPSEAPKKKSKQP
ncbi:MAG TPA: hypothetical protein VMI54_02810 [Polyangiaceae bacterium]|nr:hypothetical protein [Polyangiaceae bacterium]